jgi:nucleoside-diphosphate-sugar epimerase
MKALITGASGFIGSHLADLLLARGYSVRVLLRTTSRLEWLQDPRFEHVYGDLFDEEALRRAVEGVDYIYHLAGVTRAKSAEEYFRANQQGTRNLLDAVRRHAAHARRFVQISSQTAVGPSPTVTPIDETAPPKPLTNYGKSKLGAEQECHQFFQHFPLTIVRPPAVFGPRDRDIFEYFNTLNKGLLPIVGFSDKYVSLIHSADLVRGFVQAGESPKSIGETYFVSSARPYTWREFGDIATRLVGKRVLRVRVPEPLAFAVAAVAEGLSLFSAKPALINFEKARDMVQDYWTCDSSKATRDFGFRQEIGLEEGIRDTVEWYRTQGWLT